MIKIIGGKRYNTDKAEMVFKYWNGQYQGDFNYRTKTLYRTQNGAWFLYHYGGPMTDMAERVAGGGLGWGERIEPVGDGDVFGFLQAHSDEVEAQEAIEKYFADNVVDA